jgi:hypothetical protein
VLDLRRADAPSKELATQLTSYGASFLQTSEVTFHASVVGQPVPLNPVAADEVLNIGREAMGNTFMHAEARSRWHPEFATTVRVWSEEPSRRDKGDIGELSECASGRELWGRSSTCGVGLALGLRSN